MVTQFSENDAKNGLVGVASIVRLLVLCGYCPQIVEPTRVV